VETPLPEPDNDVEYLSPDELPERRRGFGSVLRNRSFLSLWIAQASSQTAQNTLWYVLVIMVSELTGQNALGVGVTIILVQLPTVLFSSISGVIVDRVSKRAILVGTNVVRVVGVLLYVFFQADLGILYLITFLVAVVSQPFAPAEGSSIALVVEDDDLIAANSLFQMTFMASQAIGFALAPIALGLLDVRITLFILAGLFTLAAAVLVNLPQSTRAHRAWSDFRIMPLIRQVAVELLEALKFVIHDPPLAVALVQISLAPTLLLVLAEIGPGFLSALHIGRASTSLFFLLAPAGAGLGIGLFVLGQFGERLRKERLVLVSLIALGITVIGLGSVPTLALFWHGLRAIGLIVPSGVQFTVTIIPLSALMGIEVAFINAPVQTIVQQRATDAFRGRVLGMQQTLTAAMAIPPLILVGGIATFIGIPATLGLMGVVMVAIGLVVVYYAE